jgi:hypothetical protein
MKNSSLSGRAWDAVEAATPPPRYIELSTARTISSVFVSFPSKTYSPFDKTKKLSFITTLNAP